MLETGMYRIASIVIGLSLFAVGLVSLFKPNWAYYVQFDLFQSFLYAVVGAIGIKLGFGRHSVGAQWYYTRGVGIGATLLLLLGLTFPNFRDIVHLEVPEHFLHALLGVGALFASDRRLSLS